jgi:hypothetical protein
MGTLARQYPELASFTADATLLEIKTIYGLGSLEEVRRLGRRRAEAARPSASGHAAGREPVASERSRAVETTPRTGR